LCLDSFSDTSFSFHSIIVANPILLFFFFLVKRKKIINPFIGCATIELQVANLFSQK
jgi:hypothetical protein